MSDPANPDTELSNSVAAPRGVQGVRGVQGIISAHLQAIMEPQRRLQEVMSAHLAAIMEPQRRMQEQLSACIRAVMEPQRRMQEAMAAHIRAIIEPQRRMQEALSAHFRAIMEPQRRLQEAMSAHFRAIIEPQRRLRELFAEIAFVQSDCLALDFQADESFGELQEELTAFKALACEPIDKEAREGIFAFCDSAEFLPEREFINKELSKRDDFDSLSIASQLNELRAILTANSSPRLLVYGVALAVNWLSTYCQIQNEVLLIVVVMSIFAADIYTSSQRVRSAKKAIRSTHIPTAQRRIVTHGCAVFESTKRHARIVCRLEAGFVVEIGNKFGGWQAVTLFDSEQNGNRIGWIRSKYLSKIRSAD